MFGSTLWAAPVSPNRWFDPALIERSRAYHQPLVRAALVRATMQAFGLVLALLVVRSVLDPASGSRVGPPLLAGAVVALAMWLPRVAVDGWMEFRHEPRFGIGEPLPVERFLAVSTISSLGVIVFGALVSAFIHRAAVATPWWPVVVLVGGVAVVTLTGPIGVRLAHERVPLGPEIEAELTLVAAAGGVHRVAWGRMTTTVEAGMNAVSIGGPGQPLVLCTDALLGADPELRNFVVAHEIGHLRRGHHQRAVLTSLVGLAAQVGALWLAERWLLHGRLIDGGADRGGVADPRNWPLAVAIAALVAIPVAVLEAWLSRSHERTADLDAMGSVGVPALAVLRSLHEHDRSDLAPGFLARLFAPHPSPAERLMRAERLAKAR